LGIIRRRDLTVTLLTDEWLERVDKNVEQVEMWIPKRVVAPPWEEFTINLPE